MLLFMSKGVDRTNTKWLAFSYKMPSEPSKSRVYIWRAMKELGAAYLQQGVALLPHNENTVVVFQKLYTEVAELGGEATLSELSFINENDERKLLAEFERLRNEEYKELSHHCEKLVYEINREVEKGIFCFTELEEFEEELCKIKRWLNKISARDYFNVKSKTETQEKIEQTKKRLQEYSDEVYTRDKNQL